MHRQLFIAIAALLILSACGDPTPRILVFTEAKGFRHESISNGVAAVVEMGTQKGFKVDTSSNSKVFTERKLRKYSAVVFLNTTGDVLEKDEQQAFERYIQAGGGFVGVHSAADTEHEWPWYNKLVGAYFADHPQDPNVRKATVLVGDTSHLSMKGLPAKWGRTDEWYNYTSVFPGIKVLAKLDESSYEGGKMGAEHPIAWYHSFDGGRAFYTGGGHTSESFSEPLFLKHLLGGILYAMGDGTPLDYDKAYASDKPEDNRFTRTTLSEDLNEPMELAVAGDNNVYFIERNGKLYHYDPETNKTAVVHNFPIMRDSREGFGNGLLGVTLDPDFLQNHYIYVFYTPDKYPLAQHVSRFTMTSKSTLDPASEKVVLKIPIDLERSAHTGGSMDWDKDGNLYISTGDNTVPSASDGYAPLDITPGRPTFDAQRSAANTNDLRGKILRIHPEPDGSYTIPANNLFPAGTPNTKPEIYAMGCRNPYRISVDKATGYLYWGEIGPDAGEDGDAGPKGYDEINQAKAAGYFGWPYVQADNKPYHAFDFATKKAGPLFDPAHLVNTSPHNTGMRELPPAQKALIWYPYDRSSEFSQLGESGRSAMAGPVFHYQPSLQSKTQFPAFYDGALFIFDWMRNWIFIVRLDEDQNYKSMEPFMATNGKFKRPIDMAFGPDGDMYLLEYGSEYGEDNDDARLVRITYRPGNRAPQAIAAASDTAGLAPMTVNFNSSRSFDPDSTGELHYQWTFGDGEAVSHEANPSHVFKTNGVYKAVLSVTDQSGETSTDSVLIRVGNTVPKVEIYMSSFYFDAGPAPYRVDVTDKEDRTIDPKWLSITFHYVPRTMSVQQGHQDMPAHPGKLIMDASDCKACHQVDKALVGPSMVDVAKRYQNDKNHLSYLSNKIIKGGGGVWGDHSMSAHPQMPADDAKLIVEYIMTLTKDPQPGMPRSGNVKFTGQAGGHYVMAATYTDAGGKAAPLTTTSLFKIRPARLLVDDADSLMNIKPVNGQFSEMHNGSWFVVRDVNLKDIKTVKYRYVSPKNDGKLEVHADSPSGTLISSLSLKASDVSTETKGNLNDPGGKHDLYFVFKNEDDSVATLEWLEFKR